MASLGSVPVLLVLVLLASSALRYSFCRWLTSWRSGGPFFAPFNINRGIFNIHVPLCFSQLNVPTWKRLKQITLLATLRGRAGGGSRYAFYIELRNGKTIPLFFWEKQAQWRASWGN